MGAALGTMLLFQTLMDDFPAMEAAARAVFRQSPLKYNCAQSVVHGYLAVHPECKLIAEEFRIFGGGNAPGGLCGAVFGACCAMPDRAEELREAFRARVGGDRCRDLKREHGCDCHENVSLALRLLADRS